jgi:hypothetical protein
MPKQPRNKQNTTDTSSEAAITPDNSTSSVEKKRRGSPSQYPVKVLPYMADIARYTKCGVTEGQLCLYYGVGKTQWVQYKKDFPELAETLFKAKQEFKTDVINKSYEVAMGYEYAETVTVDLKDTSGNVVGHKVTTYKKFAKPDAGMLQFLLINRFPTEYARDPQSIELRKKALELAEQGKMPPDGGEGF